MSPNGQPNVNNAEQFRLWLVGELREFKTKLDALPCEKRGEELDEIKAQQAAATGRWALLKPLLPWILAAMAGGGLLGLGGKHAIDRANGSPQPPPGVTTQVGP